MSSTYTNIAFTSREPDQPTAMKLNKLRDDLSTAIAAGGGTSTGDMLKSVYDTNNNGKVDTCDSLPWGSVTGKPATIGDMLKSIYDTNGDGISDHAAQADSVPWTGVTGRPSVFPPDSTAMLKSVYDTNNDGISDHAALSDSVPWTGITGKPSTFPPDSTAMLKSVYDTNNDGISDHAALSDAVPWTGVTGKPATFPPDSTAMLKSVYDTNNDGISDHAALADSATAVAWTGITGKPASFTPSAHASTHLDNGSDPIAVVTTLRTGLAPVLSGNAATYLNGAGAFNQVAYANVTGTPTVPAPSSTTPAMDGTAAIGVGTTYARNDHVHPSDTSRYAASNPSGYISANQTITLSGDATGSGATAITTTLATVNANVGTFQGLTVNAKGLVTAASNQNYATSASVPLPSSTTPVMDGTGAVGILTTYARADHVHPSDTSRVATTRLVSTSQSLAGGGDLSADRTLTLVGDSSAPGNSMFYGTNSSGVRGWFAQATGTVNPGTWTNLTYSTGWTQNTTAQFRVEVNGTFSKVICQGIINYASGAASLAFTLPAGAQPGVTRGCVLSGFDSSGDVLLFSANVSTIGAVTILPMVRQSFVWPSATNGSVYLDNLTFAL